MIRISFLLFILRTAVCLTWAQGDIEQTLEKADLVYNQNPAESFALCESAERKAGETDNHNFDGDICFCKARYYLLIAKYDAANNELAKATAFFEKKDDKVSLSSVYNLKNILLSRIGEEDEAHTFMLKVVDLDRETNNIDHLISALGNLSLDYNRRNQPDSMHYVLQQLEDLEEHFEPTDYLYFYQNWGFYYLTIADYERAILQFTAAVKVAEEQKMTDSKATNLAALSQAYRKKGELSKAEKFAEESYTFSQENNLIYETSEALIEWIAVKEEKGDFKGAFEIQKKWIRADKKINDLERIQKVKAMESQLELAEKEKKIVEGEVALQESKLRGQKARTRNAWLIGIIVLVIVLLGYTVFVYRRTRKLNKTINEQKEEVEFKSLKLEEAIENIQDSLRYSVLIQNSMLPERSLFEKAFEQHFILFKPKDIVSGDFYWFHELENELILAVGDCTGHGVPGAMVSMVCAEALNKVVVEQDVRDPGKILDQVRTKIAGTFKRNTHNLSDGMDVTLITLPKRGDKRSLKYAGANNNLWIFRDKKLALNIDDSNEYKLTDFRQCQLIELKADKQPVGHYPYMKPFKTVMIDVIPSDKIYLFSDGYADQFGGDKGKKLKASNLKEIIAKSVSLNMSEQHEHLENIFMQWRGELEQLDDVCIVGLKV